MSQEKRTYILVIRDVEHSYSCYNEHFKLSPPGGDIPVVWELTSEEFLSWHNLFRQVKRYENWTFVEVVLQEEATINQMWDDLRDLQEREEAAERKRAELKEANRQKRLARDAAKRERDNAQRRAMYEQLKNEFETK